MKPTDAVGVTFVNTVVAQGSLNGVVNLSLGQLLFTPDEKAGTIEPDLVICARLRMDMVCAKNLRDSLIDLLNRIAQAEAEAVPGAVELAPEVAAPEKAH